MRLFVAIGVPDVVTEIAVELQKKLKRTGFLEGDYVGHENFHITLAFLGEVEEKSVEGVINRVEVFKGQILLKLDKAEVNDIRRPRVAWLRFEAGREAYLSVESLKKSLGLFEKDAHRLTKFHLTVVRIKKVFRREKFFNLLDSYFKNSKNSKNNLDKPEFVVSKIYLKRSIFKYSGLFHETIYTHNL